MIKELRSVPSQSSESNVGSRQSTRQSQHVAIRDPVGGSQHGWDRGKPGLFTLPRKVEEGFMEEAVLVWCFEGVFQVTYKIHKPFKRVGIPYPEERSL